MKLISSTLFLIFIFSINGCSKNEDFTSSKVKFNSDWYFLKVENETITDEKFISDNNFDSWEKVSLPHTANIEPKVVNNQWQGISWYKKEFSLPIAAKGKKHFLHFEGAMNIAEVWVNNKKLIKHHGGYLPFVIDFSEIANFDKKNTIAIKLNNKDNPITGPKPLETLDFNTYGGIYRNVWLLTKNELYITDAILENKTASGGIFVTYPKVSKEKASINIKTHIRNESDKSNSFLVRNTLLKNNIEVVSVDTEKYDLAINDHQQITSNIELKNPNLWSPKTPDLYNLRTEIIQNGSVIDAEITKIGIKTMKFVGQDLYLNGEKTFLRGVNRHQEYPFIGYALSDNANYRDAKKIKDAGFDYVRLSHYPQSMSFMNACDELGLVTIDAILGWQYFSEDKKFQKHVFQTTKDLIRRDRNHASVMAWEVSLNESWMPEPFIDSLITIAKKEYPGDQNFTAGWQSYGYDMYLQARQHRLKHYNPKLKKPYNVSEYGDWEYYAMNAGLNQDDWSGLLQQERSSRQLRSVGEKALLQQATNIQEAHNDNLNTPAFADGYWVMFDYNRGYADDLEASGIMDVFRLPKPAYYFYKSQRDANDPFGKPMVYIANNWQKDSPLDIRIFSNCDEVELFLNGKSLGKKNPNTDGMSTNLKHPPFTFTIPKFVTGTLEAKGYLNKKLVVSDSRKTPLAPKNIKIVIDNEYDNLEKLDSDVFFVHAYITDKNGTITPNFNGEITFKVDKGNVQIIGESTVSAVAGIASVLVKTTSDINDIQFSATSKDLKINAKSESQVQNISKRFLNQQDKSNGFCFVKGDSSKKQIALTFDDGPTNISSEIIDLLNKYDAKATFFWQGNNLKKNKHIIEKAKQNGHLIANHSWNHENGNKSTNEDLWRKQVEKTFKELALNGVSEANYYRPPYGAITQQQIDFLTKKNIKTVLWSITTKDWDKTQNKEGEMFKKFQQNIHNGAIVLMHDVDYGNPQAKLQDLEQILKYGKSLGFSFVHIDDVI